MLTSLATTVAKYAAIYGLGWFTTYQLMKRYYNFEGVIEELANEHLEALIDMPPQDIEHFVNQKRIRLRESVDSFLAHGNVLWPVV